MGAPSAYTGSGTSGAVYEYTKVEGEWLEAKLTVDNGITGSEFGALSADWPRLLIGAFAENQMGGAYLFTTEAGEWDIESVRIGNPERIFRRRIRSKRRVSGSTAVIGAPYQDTHGPGPRRRVRLCDRSRARQLVHDLGRLCRMVRRRHLLRQALRRRLPDVSSRAGAALDGTCTT